MKYSDIEFQIMYKPTAEKIGRSRAVGHALIVNGEELNYYKQNEDTTWTKL